MKEENVGFSILMTLRLCIFFYTTLNYDAMRQQKVTSNNEIDF